MRLADTRAGGITSGLPGHGRPLKPKPTTPEGSEPQYKTPAGCTCGQNEKGTVLGGHGRGGPVPPSSIKGKRKRSSTSLKRLIERAMLCFAFWRGLTTINQYSLTLSNYSYGLLSIGPTGGR